MRFLALPLVSLLLGCSAPTVDLAGVQLELPRLSSGGLRVIVEDARGDVEPSYYGVARVTMGIPREVHTRGGEPLADELQAAVLAGLEAAGQETDPEAPRTLRLVLNAWESDGYFGALTFEYDLGLFVESDPVRSARVAGSQEATYTGSDQYAAACQQLCVQVLSELFQELLGSPPSGEPSAAVCAKCFAELQPDWRVCPHCATPVRGE